MPTLHTKRLIIEEATFKDASFFLELLNSPGWLEHIGDREVHTKGEAIGYIQRYHIHFYKKYGFGMYKIVLKETQQAIGLCGLVKRDTLAHFDLGFAVLPAYVRKGYAFEAASAVLDYGKKTLALETILAFTTVENIKSQQLLEKLGMQFKERTKVGDWEEDFLLYTI